MGINDIQNIEPMNQNNETPVDRGQRIANRYLEVVQNGELMMCDRIKVLQHEFNTMHFVPMSEAAKLMGMSYNGLKKRIKEGKEMFVRIGSQVFVSCPS